MTRDEVVEVMARAAYESGGYGTVSWDEMGALHGSKDRFRTMAAAALTALEAAGLEVVPISAPLTDEERDSLIGVTDELRGAAYKQERG